LGISYDYLHDYENTLKYHLLAYPIREKLNDDFGMITTCNNIASTYLTLKNADKALEYISKSYEIAKKLNSKRKLKSVYFLTSQVYQEKQDYKKSLEYYKKFNMIKDSIFTEESARSMAEMQTKYETEKKEQELLLKSEEAKNQRNRNKIQLFLFIGLVLSISFISIFLFYRFKQRQKAKLLLEKTRQEKLRYKAVIESEQKERKRVAQELHDGLGQLLSTTKMNIAGLDEAILNSDNEDKEMYKNSILLIDEAVVEVRNISHNLMPGALIKFGLLSALKDLVKKVNTAGKLKLDFVYDENLGKLSETSEIAIYRIVQEVLNNTIKHSGANSARIEFKRKEKKLFIEISDNGKGMDISKIDESKGIGWKNIYSRVDILNGNIKIISEKGKGTKLFIDLEID